MTPRIRTSETDSGAIIVAAATSAAPHTRLAYSTFGARIDCYGWGQNVDTLSSSSAGTTTTYTGTFSGTSSASPIVAGAALSLQGIYEANQHLRLSPRQMRAILSDSARNTPPSATETTAMGVMPKLRAIIDNQLSVTPDVYIRDSISDTGEPHTGSISASPDVILRPATVANPQAAYGNGSGTELNLAWIRSRGRARQLHLRPGFEPRHDYGHKHNGDGVLVTGLNAGDAEPLDIGWVGHHSDHPDRRCPDGLESDHVARQSDPRPRPLLFITLLSIAGDLGPAPVEFVTSTTSATSSATTTT